MSEAPRADRSAPFTRAVLALNTLLAASAGLSLSLAPTRTNEFFAFEIEPPVTAAWFGANFAAGAILELAALRERLWANASQAVLGVLVYDIGITAALMASLDAFPIDRPAAWVWLIVYCVSPLSLLCILWTQRNSPRRPRAAPMPGALRLILLIPGAIGLALGLALLLAPALGESLWPWRLVPQTGSYGRDPTIVRYAGAWHAGIGATLLHAGVVGDIRRSRSLFIAGLVAAPLTILAMLRFRAQVDWAHPASWAFLATLAAAAGSGAWALARSRTA